MGKILPFVLPFVLLFGACDGYTPPSAIVPAPPGAKEAAVTAWQLLGRNDSMPPIYWLEGSCAIYQDGTCIGVGVHAEDTIYIARDTHDVLTGGLWRSSLTHELMHEILERDTGNPDGDHTGAVWKGWGTVDMVNDQLRQLGFCKPAPYYGWDC
jgi:hypothetical protein